MVQLNSLGLRSDYLGSAQCDKKLESKSVDPSSEQIITFVTPQWITKMEKKLKLIVTHLISTLQKIF